MLKGNQKKLDKNKDGKISGEDFKMMKAKTGKDVNIDLMEKIAQQSLFGKGAMKSAAKSAKKKNMGGEMMKARYGTMAKGDVKEGLKKSSKDRSNLMKFKARVIKKISGAQISEAESEKLKNMIPKITDSGSVRQAKKNAVTQKISKLSVGGEPKSTQGYGAARTSGMGLQDEQLPPGKSLDYYKDIM